MKKSYLLYALLATTALGVTSCKDDMDGFSTSMDNSIQVNAMIGGGVSSRSAATLPTSAETTTSSLTSFNIYAWQEGASEPVMATGTTYAKADGATTFTKSGVTYWPEGVVKFWAYAVDNNSVSNDALPTLSDDGTTITKSYEVSATAQDDPVLAYTAQAKHADDNYVNLTFQHLLSRVTVNAYAPHFTEGYVRVLSFGFTDVNIKGKFSYTCANTTSAFAATCWTADETNGNGNVGASASTETDATTWYTAMTDAPTSDGSITWAEGNGPVAPQTQESTLEPLKYEGSSATVQLPWLNIVPGNNVANKLVLTYQYYNPSSKIWATKVATLEIPEKAVPGTDGSLPTDAANERYNPGYQYVYNVRILGQDSDDASVTEAEITLDKITVTPWNTQNIDEVKTEAVGNGQDLKTLIEKAQAFSTITLNNDIDLTEAGTINITKPLTINLAGHTIKAPASGVIFNISGSAASVTITGGYLDASAITNEAASPAKGVRSKASGDANGVIMVSDGAQVALSEVNVTSGSAALSCISVDGADTKVSVSGGEISNSAAGGKLVETSSSVTAANVTVSGATLSNNVFTADELTSAIAAGANDITIGADITADVVIPATFDGTIDLNGKTLTNSSSNTITVAKGAILTIKGNGGTVDNKTHQKAAIYNMGTLTLDGGTYDRSAETGVDKDTSGGNSYYTILNHGTMTVANVTVNNSGHYSSMFENGYFSWKTQDGIENPTLTITSGTFDGGLNTIKNDDNATITIDGGTYKNYTQACVQNHNVATINGGTFTSSANAVLECGACSSSDEHDAHTMTITGGTFTGGVTVGSFATLSITGGTFSVAPSAYVASGYAATQNGDVWTVAASASSGAKRYIRRR